MICDSGSHINDLYNVIESGVSGCILLVEQGIFLVKNEEQSTK